MPADVTNDMAHPHRRHDDPDDGKRHVVQDVVESTAAKVFARAVVPVLLAIIGFFLVRTLNEVADNQRASAQTQADQGRDISQLKSDMRVVTTRLDEGVIRQVTGNTQRIDDHEKRIQLLERTVKTP